MAAEVAVVIRAKDQTKGVFAGVQNRLGGLAKVAKTAFIGVGAGVAIAGAAITKFTLDAAKVEQSRNTFDKLAQSVGDNLPNALEKMQRSTRGMVADQDLFLAGNRFLNMGLAATTDEAAKLSEMGSQLALAMGGEATQGMEDFALMLANQSLPRLDTFGISSGRVRERILELMAADKSLTREMAFTAAVMEEGSKAMERVGEQGEGAAAEYAKFKTVLTNLKTEVGRAFLPIMTKLLSKVLIPTAKWLAQRLVPWMGKFSGILEKLVTKIGQKLGPFIEMFRKLGTIFGIIQDEGIADFFQNFGDILGEFFVGRVGRTAYAIQANLIEPFTTLYRIIREYGLADFFQNFGDIIGDVFVGKIGRAAYAIQANLIDPLLRLGRKAKEAFEQVKGALVGVWQDHIFPRLEGIATGVQTWWQSGGLGKTLDTISTGWSRIAGGLKGFYEAYVGPHLGTLMTRVGEWWEDEGGAKGILNKIGAGWATHIADPLFDFYNKHLADHLWNLKASLTDWWAELTSGEGPMLKLKAMWQEHLADPISRFWEDHGSVFTSLATTLSGWATGIAGFIEKHILEPLGLIAPKVTEETEKIRLEAEQLGQPMPGAPKESWWDRIARTISTLWDAILEKTKGIRTWLLKILLLLKDVAVLFKEAMLKGMEENWKFMREDLLPTLSDVIGRVQEWAREHGKGTDDIARDLEQNKRDLEEREAKITATHEHWWAKIERTRERIQLLSDQIRNTPQPPPIVYNVYTRYHGTPPGGTIGEPGRGSYTPPGEPGGLPAYDIGGVVPGPIGMPQLGILHGGEEVLTPGQRRGRGGNYYDFRGAQLYGISEDMVEEMFEAADLKRRLQGIRND